MFFPPWTSTLGTPTALSPNDTGKYWAHDFGETMGPEVRGTAVEPKLCTWVCFSLREAQEWRNGVPSGFPLRYQLLKGYLDVAKLLSGNRLGYNPHS